MVNRGPSARMALMNDKRGFFFTALTIVLISLFLLTYGIYNEFKERTSEQKRVKTLNGFLQSLEADLERQAYIMGFRAIFIIESKIGETGVYSSSVLAQTNEIIKNGTLEGISQPLMIGATFNEIVTTANEKALKLNAEINFTSPTITVFQTDPWNVIIQINSTMHLRDRNNKAAWILNKSIEVPIRVENFEDPLYTLNTNGLITNKITKTPTTLFTQGSDVSVLLAHATNSYYTETPLAPNFINRLEGNLTPSPTGIESLVNLQELSGAGVIVQDKTVIDHIYFSGQTPLSYRIQGMPSWFKVSSDHLTLYGVENLTL